MVSATFSGFCAPVQILNVTRNTNLRLLRDGVDLGGAGFGGRNRQARVRHAVAAVNVDFATAAGKLVLLLMRHVIQRAGPNKGSG